MAQLNPKDLQLLKELEKYKLRDFTERLLKGEFKTETEASTAFKELIKEIAGNEKNPIQLIKSWYGLEETGIGLGKLENGMQTETGAKLLKENFFRFHLELIEEDEKKIQKGEEELFRDPLLRLIQLIKKIEQEKDIEKKQELESEILKVEKQAWENFKKIIFSPIQQTSQESAIKLLESWINKPPALREKTYLNYLEKQREKHPTTYLPLSIKDLLEIHKFLNETEFRQDEIATISARNKKLGFLALHNIAYHSLKHLLGSEAFPQYEECVKKITQNGGHMANCLEQALHTAIRNNEMAEREALSQLNNPLGWALGYVYIVQYILSHIRKKNLHGMQMLVKKQFNKFENKLAEFYTGLTSESVATYRLYNRFIKDLGAVKIDKEYEEKFIRGLITESLRKELDIWQYKIHKRIPPQDIVKYHPFLEAMKKEVKELRKEMDEYISDFEKGKISFKEFKNYIETLIQESQNELFKKKLTGLLNDFEKRINETPEGLKFKTEYKSNYDMEILKGKKLTIARDKEGNIIVVNNSKIKKAQVDPIVLFREFKDKPALNIKKYNRNIVQQYAETVYNSILSPLYVPEKEGMEIPTETLKQGISLPTKEEMKGIYLTEEEKQKRKEKLSPKI